MKWLLRTFPEIGAVDDANKAKKAFLSVFSPYDGGVCSGKNIAHKSGSAWSFKDKADDTLDITKRMNAMKHATRHRGIRHSFLALFSLYFIFLCYVLLFRASPEFIRALFSGAELPPRAVHIIPFETTCFYLFHYNKRLFLDNVLANYAVFIPFGFFFAGFYQTLERKWMILLIGAGVSLGFELLQMWFHLGEFDVDDIMLNAVGMWTGGLLLYRLQRCKWLVRINERMMRK